jgi:hypothetical protein
MQKEHKRSDWITYYDINYPNLRHGSRVIPMSRDSYFTKCTQAETLYRNPLDSDRASTLDQIRAEKPCWTLKDSYRASVLEL